MLVVPYSLNTNFNGLTFFDNNPNIRRCPVCYNPTHKWEETPDYKKKPKHDISLCSDGVYMVSGRFKEMYEYMHFFDVDFRSFSNGFFGLFPTRAVELDEEHQRITRLKFCSHCGQYEEILSGQIHPRLSSQENPIELTEIARTRLDFSHKRFKHFFILVGDNVRSEIIRMQLTGAEFNKMSPQLSRTT